MGHRTVPPRRSPASGPPSGLLQVHPLRGPLSLGHRTVPPRLSPASGPPSGLLQVHPLRGPLSLGHRTVPPRLSRPARRRVPPTLDAVRERLSSNRESAARPVRPA